MPENVTLDEVAAVTMPFGWLEPVPVVKWSFWMRAMRSPSARPMNPFTSIDESCRNSCETSTDLDEYLYACSTSCPKVMSTSETCVFSARIAPLLLVSSEVGIGMSDPVAVRMTVATPRIPPNSSSARSSEPIIVSATV